MATLSIRPTRFQLNKETEKIVRTRHPWIFNTHLSTAASVFKSGQWLSLVNGSNEIVGYGLFEKNALVSIRVFKIGKTPPDSSWIKDRLTQALKKREHLKNYTDAFRALHGENDGLPGIVFDVYGRIGVLQTYVPSVDKLGRYVAQVLRRELNLRTVLWKYPSRRKAEKTNRVLYGENPILQKIREGKLNIAVDIGEGQKSGTFLDLRGLRKFVAMENLKGKKILNLFSYTGTLGLAAEVAGATEIWNVDISKGAIEFSKTHHVQDSKKFKFVIADVFKWAEALAPHEKFDFIIVDPPSMASLSKQVPGALKAYQKIYKLMLGHLKPKGKMLVCCCTSRINREQFRDNAEKCIGTQMKCIKSIAAEEDHPVGFPQGDYLKMLVYVFKGG